MAKQLRVHHLLCTSLFVGEGYSEGFAAGMARQVKLLREQPSMEVMPVSSPDDICRNCPHLTPENTCDSNNNQVADKDRRLAELLQITIGEIYTYEELLRMVWECFAEADFQEICGRCSWNKAGLCTYEKLRRHLAMVLDR